MLPYILCGLAALILFRVLTVFSTHYESNRLKNEEFEKWQKAVEFDPNNAGAHAHMAEFFFENRELDNAIHSYRTAISLMPHGPFSDAWKRKLKTALEIKAALDRGEKIPAFNDLRVCHNCHQQVLVKFKKCPNCGAILHMNPIEFLTQPHIARAWARETMIISVVITLVLWIGGIIFTALPIEWKGCIIMASVMVGGWYLLRAINGDL
jgi:tetratricopeptide (TPR) repeat protein